MRLKLVCQFKPLFLRVFLRLRAPPASAKTPRSLRPLGFAAETLICRGDNYHADDTRAGVDGQSRREFSGDDIAGAVQMLA